LAIHPAQRAGTNPEETIKSNKTGFLKFSFSEEDFISVGHLD